MTVELDPREFVTRPQGRRAWVREGRRALEATARARAPPDRQGPRPSGCLRRAGAWRKSSTSSTPRTPPMRPGARAASPPTGRGGWRPAWSSRTSRCSSPTGLINITDHDSRPMRTHGYKPLQGYNAQAGRQRAADRHRRRDHDVDSPDFGHLEPMVDAAQRELQRPASSDDARASCSPTPATGTSDQMRAIVGRRHPGARSRPTPASARATRPGWDGGLYDVHAPRARHRARRRALPPTPGDDRAGLRRRLKFNRGIDRFQRRGRAACRVGMAADHRHPQPPGMKLPGEGSGGGVRARS